MQLSAFTALLAPLFLGAPDAEPVDLVAVKDSSPPAASMGHNICQGGKADRILIRVIRPAIGYRVPPSVKQINDKGDRYVMVRDSAVWKTVAGRLCENLISGPEHSAPNIGRRIIVYAEGSKEGDVLSIEYPDVLLRETGMLKGELGKRKVQVHADDIRVLLDHAGREAK